MKTRHKLLRALAAVILLMGMIGLASWPAGTQAAHLHPLVAQLAAAAPERIIAVIVQKADASGAAQALVAQLGGRITKDLRIINAFVAELPARAAQQLAASPAVRWVSLDATVVSTSADSAPNNTCAGCPPNYYLETLNVQPVWGLGLQGQGITVAVIDSGITNDADFRPNRIVASEKFNPNALAPTDGFGHGTHVAGIIGGSGLGANGFYMGIAPQVNLISLKISDHSGMAYESDTVTAMQWVLDNRALYNIRVVNLSINSTAEGSYHTSPIDAAAEILWFNGLVVVASAGNTGPGDGFNTANAAPANDPFIITVGASDEKQTSSPADDVVAPFSAFGTTVDGFIKPDIIAPGKDIYSVYANTSNWHLQHPDRVVEIKTQAQYFRLSGTSMAAPMVSGAVALMLQKEPGLTPDQVKYRLLSASPTILGSDARLYPYLNVYAAVTATTTQSANTGITASQLLWSGSNPVTWSSVNWNSVNWNSVNWNSVNWNSVNWNSVNWNSVHWN